MPNEFWNYILFSLHLPFQNIVENNSFPFEPPLSYVFTDVEDPFEEMQPEMGLVGFSGNLSSIEMLSCLLNDLRDERLLEFLVSLLP